MKMRNQTTLPEQINTIVANWDDVEVHPHRFGGKEFRFMDREFGHIHIQGSVDIPFSTRVRDQLITEGIAARHHYLPETGWVTVPLDERTDIEQVLKVLRFSYLLQAIEKNAASLKAVAELNILGFSRKLLQLAIPAEYENSTIKDT